jgi:3-(3-hydroxy-phenyl)propionate hydroxylase/flavoprotein hydroxylase
VRTVTETGMLLGRRHTLRDPAAAAERDRAMRQARDSATAPAKLLLPGLGPGLLSSRHRLGAGQLSAHGVVTSDGRRGLLDDVAGGGFCLLATAAAAGALTADGLGKRLRDAGVRVIELVPDGCEAIEPAAVVGIRVADTGGTYRRWLAELGAAAVVVRPDFYVYGAVADAAATPDLGRELLGSISRSRR